MRSFFLLLLSLFCYCIPGNSQSDSNFTVRYYTTENGLPSNGIKGLQWDEKTGFLWIATEAGVARFNGIDFKSYTKENSDIILSERMQFLIRSLDGNIYGYDQVGTVINVNQNKIGVRKRIITENNSTGYSLYGLSASDLFFEEKQNNPGTLPFVIRFDKFIPLNDSALLIIKNNSLYYSTLGNNQPEALNFSNIKFKEGFLIDKKSFLVSENNEIFLFEISSKKLSRIAFAASPDLMQKFISNKTNLLWETGLKNPVLIFGNTAWQLVYDGSKIIAEEICNVIPGGILFQYAQYSKEKKILFLGSNSKGIIVISANKVQSVKNPNPNDKERNAYYSQIELLDGNILTNEGHIIGTAPVSNLDLPVKGKFGFNISRTSDGVIWYTKNEPNITLITLHSYDLRTGITTNYPNIKTGNAFVRIINNKTIVVTQKGIGEFVGDSVNYLKLLDGIGPGSTIGDVSEIKPGVIAIAVKDGILRFNTNSLKLDTIIHEENLTVRSLFVYKDYLFAGTYGKGFYILKGDYLKPMPLDKNKYLLYTHCFVPDNQGFCWISTNRGLFKASLNELINAYEKNSTTVYYHYIGKNDGMDITEMNGGCTPCAITLKKGTISFPTMDGLLWVNPEKTNLLLPEGDLYIDEVWVDNKKMSVDSLAFQKLDYNTKEIAFYLGYSAWCNKENVYIEYRLDKAAEWTNLNSNNVAVIHFYNLPKGNHTLQIRKLNGFGIDNYSYREVSFSIKTPWNERWWFYGSCILLLFGLVTGYFSFRTRQLKLRQKNLESQVKEKTKELLQKNEVLEKNNSINTRLISIISHDIITPLKFLTVAGKNLQEKRNQMPEELQQETISEITNTSQELQLLSTNILNWIKYQNENRRLVKESFNLHELVQQVLGILQSLAKQKQLTIENQVAEDLVIHQYYEPLKIMIYNLLTNAIHFTEKGKIVVSAQQINEKNVISVMDEGIGMSDETIKNLMAEQVVIRSSNVDSKKGHGLGYLIIKDLLKTMGATLKIESKKGEGSIVFISFPAKNGSTKI